MIDLYMNGKRLDTDQQTDAAITLSIGAWKIHPRA